MKEKHIPELHDGPCQGSIFSSAVGKKCLKCGEIWQNKHRLPVDNSTPQKKQMPTGPSHAVVKFGSGAERIC